MSIDKNKFADGIFLLCDRFGRELSDPVLKKYYELLSKELSTEGFEAAVEITFRDNSFFPSPKELVEAGREFRKQQALRNPPQNQIEEERYVPTPEEFAQMRQKIKNATGKIGMSMPIPTATDRSGELPTGSIGQLKAWFRDPVTKKIAIAEAMNRDEIEILFVDGEAIDIREKRSA